MEQTLEGSIDMELEMSADFTSGELFHISLIEYTDYS